jgi:4a-hydroxytetrahydrobiopterin dehydratase
LNIELSISKCEACNIDAPSLSDDEIKKLQPQIPSWSIIEDEDEVKRLICAFAFKDYNESLNFTNIVAKLAEEEDHHPEIILEWGKVTVSWWSHKIKGLHHNDFICAAKTDKLFNSFD